MVSDNAEGLQMVTGGVQRIHAQHDGDSSFLSEAEAALRHILRTAWPSGKETPTEGDRMMLWITAAFLVLLSLSAAMWFIVIEYS